MLKYSVYTFFSGEDYSASDSRTKKDDESK